MLCQNDFIGTWSLVEYVILSKEGRILNYPYGKDAIGWITYTKEGVVSVHVMKKERMVAPDAYFRDGSELVKLEIAESYAGYCGYYKISEIKNQITHKLFISSFPQLMQNDQIRDVSFLEGKLVLSCEDGMEKGATARLTWEKKAAL